MLTSSRISPPPAHKTRAHSESALSPMLAAPLKQTGGGRSTVLDWAEPLSQYILAHYGEAEGDDVSARVSQDFQILTNARQRATQVILPDAASLDAVHKYLGMLDCVEEKFPALNANTNLCFSWTDALRPKQKPITSSSIQFERANLLYNLAALESLAGINIDVRNSSTNSDATKQASAHFARAAGIFSYLLDHQLTSGAVPCDLSPEALSMLKWLMLAQTQVCFYEKAVLDGMRPSVLSKIAAQSALFFDKAMDCAKTPVLAKALDAAWLSHLDFHKQRNDTWATYHQAQAVRALAGYGELVAWLQLADDKCKHAVKLGADVVAQGVLLPLRTLQGAVHHELAQAIKDNETIYFASVPAASTLPALAAHVLAKEVPYTTSASSSSVLFRTLVQPWMARRERAFQQQLQSRVNALGGKIESVLSDVRQGLHDANLPASVELGQKQQEEEQGLPAAVWARIGHGTGQLESDFAANTQSRDFLLGKLAQVERDLQQEEQEASSTTSGTTTTTPSSQLNRNMYQDLRSFRQLLQQAKQSDDALLVRITSSLSLLNLSKPELDSLMPPSSSHNTQSPQVEDKRLELSLLLIDLGSKMVECEEAQIALAACASGTSLLPLLTEDGAEAEHVEEAVLAGELRHLFSQVEAKVGTVQAVFSQTLELSYTFQSLLHTDDARQRQVSFLSQVDEQIGRHRECVNICREGAKFYAELATQVQQLGDVVADFCFVRRLEREETATAAATAPTGFPQQQQQQQQQQTIHIDVSAAAARRPSAVAAPPPGVAALRNALGVTPGEVPDLVLETYIQRANGDVNEAAMAYFESPPGGGAMPITRPPPPPPSVNHNHQNNGQGGGWFQ